MPGNLKSLPRPPVRFRTAIIVKWVPLRPRYTWCRRRFKHANCDKNPAIPDQNRWRRDVVNLLKGYSLNPTGAEPAHISPRIGDVFVPFHVVL